MTICALICYLRIPGCRSLKEKRSRVKPLINRLHREFNVSSAEIDRLDQWDETVIGCANISNDPAFSEKCMQEIVDYIENQWNDLQIEDFKIEFR
jgi:uncharacterized protein YlxP (DUF503 family)